MNDGTGEHESSCAGPGGGTAPRQAGTDASRPHTASMSRIARGAWYGLWAQAVDKLLPVVVVLYLARSLPRELFGLYAFLLAYLAFFQVLSDYSIDTVLVRKLSQTDADKPRVLRAGQTLKFLTGVLSAVVATALARPISGGQVSTELAFFAALTLPTGLGGAYRAYFRSTLEIRSVFLINAGRGLMLALAIMAVAGVGYGIRGVFLAMAAVNLASFALVSWLLRRRIPPGLFYADVAMWRELLQGVLPLFVNALAMTLSLRIGQILLMSMRGPVAVGYLGAASRVSEAFSVVPEALMITVYPLMAGLHGRQPGTLMRTAERSARYLVSCTGIPVILCTVDSEQVMSILFGAGFAQAGPILAVLTFTALLGATGAVILNLLVAVHQERALYRNTVTFAVVNTVASFVLIGWYGEIGAASAFLASSAASQIALASISATADYVRPLLLSVLRVFGAVIVGVAAARWSGLSAVPATALALGVYAFALVASGVWNRDEIRFVRSVLESARTRSA
jgi:O-antigen/teichoic acid export membrane protein